MNPALLHTPSGTGTWQILEGAAPSHAMVVDAILNPVKVLSALESLTGPALRNEAVAVLRFRSLTGADLAWALLGAAVFHPLDGKKAPHLAVAEAFAAQAARLATDTARWEMAAALLAGELAAPPTRGDAGLMPAAILRLLITAHRCGGTPRGRLLAMLSVVGLAHISAGFELLAAHQPFGMGATFGAWLDAIASRVGASRGTAASAAIALTLAGDEREAVRELALYRLFWLAWNAAAGASQTDPFAPSGNETPAFTRSVIPHPTSWDAAEATPVVGVEPTVISVEGIVRSAGHLPDAAELVVAADQRELTFFARDSSGAFRFAPASRGPGWVGFSWPELVEASQTFRTGVSDSLLAAALAADALPDVAVAEAARSVSSWLPTRLGDASAGGFRAEPPITGSNRFDAVVAPTALLEVTPTRIELGGTVEIRWRADSESEVRLGAAMDGAKVDLGPGSSEGSMTWAPPSPGTWEIDARSADGSVSATRLDVVDVPHFTSVRAGASLRWSAPAPVPGPVPITANFDLVVEAAVPPDARPDIRARLLDPSGEDRAPDQRALNDVPPRPELSMTWSGLPPGPLTLIVELSDRERVWDERQFMLTVGGDRSLAVVFPSVIDETGAHVQVIAERLERRLDQLAREAGLTLRFERLAWTPDELAAVTRPLPRGDVGREILSARLENLAVCSPGGEAMAWIAFLPANTRGRDSTPLLREASGAWRVGVVSEEDEELRALIDELQAEPPRGDLSPQLRVALTLGDVPAVHVREDARLPAPSPRRAMDEVGPSATLTLQDRQERTLARLGPLLADRDGRAGALIPCPDEAHQLVMSGAHRKTIRVERPERPGPAALDASSFPLVSWSWDHPAAARARATLEASLGNVWVPVLRDHRCGGGLVVPLERIQPGSRLRVVLSDGWNSVPLDLTHTVPGPRIALRLLRDGRLWADADHSPGLRWSLEDRDLPDLDGRRVVAPDELSLAFLGLPLTSRRVRLAGGAFQVTTDEGVRRVPAPAGAVAVSQGAGGKATRILADSSQ